MRSDVQVRQTKDAAPQPMPQEPSSLCLQEKAASCLCHHLLSSPGWILKRSHWKEESVCVRVEAFWKDLEVHTVNTRAVCLGALLL